MAKYRSRVKHRYIPLTSKDVILVSTRRFRTNPRRRSKNRKQLILHPYGVPIREIAIRKENRSAAKKLVRQQSSLQCEAGRFSWLRRQTVTMLVLTIAAAGTVYFGWQLNKPARIDLTGSRPPIQAVSRVEAAALPRSIPTHLKIESIDIDTDIVEVGLKPDHTLDVPANWLVAGWYQNSPTPGEQGPSIIDGHVDNANGLGVFWRLHEMSVGDEIMVTRADGRTVKFKVDNIEQYPRDDFPSQRVYGPINYPGLRLITCGGTFDRAKHEYSNNTVVFASIES